MDVGSECSWMFGGNWSFVSERNRCDESGYWGAETHNDILVAQIQNDHQYAKKGRPLYESYVSSKKENKPSCIVGVPNKLKCVNCDTSDENADPLMELVTDMKYWSHH